MEFEKSQKYLNNENQEQYDYSFSNKNCFINSNPIDNYLNSDTSNLVKSISVKNAQRKHLHRKKNKNYQLLNLDDPKLIQAYNEGYYGFNNVPKQYYIYPKFTKKESIKRKNDLEDSLNDYRIKEIINKENNINIMNDNQDISNKYIININCNDNDVNNDDFIYSYINYPYPKLINIGSNLFGNLHNIKSNYTNLNQNFINNNNLDDKDIKSNLSCNKKEVENSVCNNDEQTDNFYFINNNITTRQVPFQNIPDNISIDDEEDSVES